MINTRTMDTAQHRLLLLDGHSLAYRAFYALPAENFVTTTGQVTNAVYGFTSMLINVVRDERPTHLAVAFDVSRRTFRSAEFPEYKANRATTPEAFAGQISLIKDVLTALRVVCLEADGFEADDVIATLATRGVHAGQEVLICTGDRDAFQLIADQVTVLYPRKGVSDLARMTPQAMRDRYGLDPVQYPDYAALRGDPSDNLPGIPGVGEKTATKWITEFGSLAQLIERAGEVRGRAGESLRSHLSSVITNRRLTELVRDVPLEANLEDLAVGSWDRDEVHRVFDALQFRVLRDRLYQTLTTAEPEADRGFDVSVATLGPDTVADWLSTHAQLKATVAVAVAGTWGRGTGTLSAVAIATAEASAWFDPSQLTEDDDRAVAAWLADPDHPKVFHDAKGPLLAFAAQGWSVAGVSGDTALSAYLALPGQRSFDLADLTLRFLHRELRDDTDDSTGDGQLALDVSSASPTASRALAIKARAVLDVSEALDEAVRASGGERLLREVELPLVGLLADMERRGIAVDAAKLDTLSARFAEESHAAAAAAYSAAGREFNLSSPKQLQAVLFDELGLPKTKRIKTGYTTDADALSWLEKNTGHPVLEHLLRHRDVSKLRTTVDGLIPMVDDIGRIHTTFQQTIAATGRLSSTDPNLQNIPIRTAEGRQIRQAFVAGPDTECLLTADYAQIEMRIMAHLSADQGLTEAFASGEDLHAAVASRVFEVAPSDVTAEMRRRIKAMSYGLAYGLSAFGLSQQLGIGTDEARSLIEGYFGRFAGIREYLAQVVERARTDGYTETLLGRRRYLPDLTSDNRQRREIAERMALNAPIQGSAADIIKVAMLGVDRALKDEGLSSRMVLQVHDELVCEIAPGEHSDVEALIRREMGGAHPLSVSLEVSVGSGHSWDAAAH
jgi:DNA polymerase I